MSSSVVFDSAILVDALVGLSSARTEIVRNPDRWITRSAWGEVLSGARGDADRIEDYLSHFKVIELNEEITRRAAALVEQRPVVALADAISLAAAQVTGRIFVTRNTKSFPASTPGIRIPYSL